MEITENKIKNLLNKHVINEVNEETLNRILEIALSHACGKSDTAGTNY